MSKNPNPWPMTDATNRDSAHNHGFENTAIGRGQNVIEPYGMDRSTMAGTAKDERHTERGFGGGPTNLAHSLHGATANQSGKSR